MVRVNTWEDHQAAADTLAAAARAELATQVSTVKKEVRATTANVSPARRRKSSGHGGSASPLRTRTTPGGRRRSSGGANSDLPPLELLLQNLALVLPQGNDEADGTVQVDTLAAAIADRTSKVTEAARNVQQSFEASAAAQLTDARRALRMVLDSLLAESPFAEVKLVDPEIDSSITVLAQEVEKINTMITEAGTATAGARTRSAKRDELISRWGR